MVLSLKIAINYPGTFDIKAPVEDMNRKASLPVNIQRLKNKDGNSREKENHQSGWLVVTSAINFKPWLEKEFGSTSNNGKKYQIEFGIAMMDESHEEYFKQTGRGKVLCEMPSTNQPFLWGYSGTPFSQKPRGLEGVLWAIEQNFAPPVKDISGWSKHPVLKQFEWKKLDKICKDFDAQVKSDKPDNAKVAQIVADFRPFLLNFIIRRTAETKWFGHRSIKLKAHCHQDISLQLSPNAGTENYNEKIAQYKEMFQGEKKVALWKSQDSVLD